MEAESISDAKITALARESHPQLWEDGGEAGSACK